MKTRVRDHSMSTLGIERSYLTAYQLDDFLKSLPAYSCPEITVSSAMYLED